MKDAPKLTCSEVFRVLIDAEDMTSSLIDAYRNVPRTWDAAEQVKKWEQQLARVRAFRMHYFGASAFERALSRATKTNIFETMRGRIPDVEEPPRLRKRLK